MRGRLPGGRHLRAGALSAMQEKPAQSSTSITEGIRVIVRSRYVPERSLPTAKMFVFEYTVRIANEGTQAAQLQSRHWLITDGTGRVAEVMGPGVAGEHPRLRPGEHFEYTSSCVLETAHGEMRGSYRMHRPNGRAFEAAIAPFALAMPHSLN
jgi:ApaG protein